MAFKMSCPKCLGLDYNVERDNRTFGAVAQAFELVFHCRCGKQLFGDALVKEYEQQKKAYEEGAPTRTEVTDQVVAAREQQAADDRDLADRLEHRRRYEADKRRKADDATDAQRADGQRLWAEATEPAPSTGAMVTPGTVLTPAGDANGPVCAWPGCTQIRRSNSKYCSRACSNKNARHRHKQRRKKPKKAKGAEGEAGDQAAA